MEENTGVVVGAAPPGEWVTLQEVFVAPAEAIAASFQIGVWEQPEGETITIADASAMVVPESWKTGDPLPDGSVNLVPNPGFAGGHITPSGWTLQSSYLGDIHPAGRSDPTGESGLCVEGSNIALYRDFPVQPGQRLLYSLRVRSNTPNPHVQVSVVWRKRLTLAGSNIEVPGPESPHLAGYTGFNSVNLQAFYSCRVFEARRSQIMRGWGKPVIQRLPNGDLMASQYKNIEDKDRCNPQYPDAPEEAALCVSKDEGLTWSEPRLLGIPGRVNQLSVLSDGVIILAVAGRLFRSDDLGDTFTECPVPWNEFERGKGVVAPRCWDGQDGMYGDFGETNGVTEMPDGTLLVVCLTYRRPIEKYTDMSTYILRSRDRGRTWGDATFLVNNCESQLLRLADGRLLAFVRLDTAYTNAVWGHRDLTGEEAVNEGGGTMALMESRDDGVTWTDPERIGLGAAQIPAFPVLLPDGRIILTYGNRQFPFGAQAIASRDDGRTWDTKNFLMLAWSSWTNLGGHPRSILMPDGSIITGYYAHYFKDHQGGNENHDLVSHCLRWTPPDDWPPAA